MAKENKKTNKKIESENNLGYSEKKINPRGRIFEGIVKKKFPKRIVIEFERMVYVRKYERYKKSITKIHSRLPESLAKDVNIGDLVRVQECRPISKIIHSIFIKKLKEGGLVK